MSDPAIWETKYDFKKCMESDKLYNLEYRNKEKRDYDWFLCQNFIN